MLPARCRCRPRRTSTASSARRTSTRTRASTSRCAPTSASSTSSTPRRRPSTRSCGSTCRRGATSRSSSRKQRTMAASYLSSPKQTARTTAGVLGEKLGMTQVFDENNRIVPVTVVKAGPCVVTQIRTPDKDGYSAIQIAFGAIDPRKVNKPEAGHFAKAGVPPRRYTLELRTADASSYAPGQEITGELFAPGEDAAKPVKVDVVATSKGKGYAGVMKRHNFK